MLVRSDLRILDLFFSTSQNGGSDEINNKIFCNIYYDFEKFNRSYGNLPQYKYEIENKYTSQLEHIFTDKRKQCFRVNTDNNFFDYWITKKIDISTIDITSILWDLIPRYDGKVYHLLKDVLFEDTDCDSLRINFDKAAKDISYKNTIYGPKRSSINGFCLDSSLRLSEDVVDIIRFIINTILIDKLTTRIYSNDKELVLIEKEGSRKANSIGNFYFERLNSENIGISIFSRILGSAVFKQEATTTSLFSTRLANKASGGKPVNYNGLGKTINNTMNIKKYYDDHWKKFLKSKNQNDEILHLIDSSCIKSLVFEQYSRINLLQRLTQSFDSGQLTGYCRFINDDLYSQFLSRVLLLLIFELPYPLNRYFFDKLISDDGVIFAVGNCASSNEKSRIRELLLELIDYIHLIIYNLIPALDQQLSIAIKNLSISSSDFVLAEILREFKLDDSYSLTFESIPNKSELDNFEAKINRALGYKCEVESDSFALDIVQRKTLLSVLFNSNSREYLKYVSGRMSPYDQVRLVSQDNFNQNRVSYDYTLLEPLYRTLFACLKRNDERKNQYRVNYNDYDSDTLDIEKKKIIKECEEDSRKSIDVNIVWQYLNHFYNAYDCKSAAKNIQISYVIKTLLTEWIDSESLDEGSVEKVRNDKFVEAQSGEVTLDLEYIDSLLKKYDVVESDKEKVKKCIQSIDNEFNITYRYKIQNFDDCREFIYRVHQFLIFLIDCIYYGKEREEYAYKRLSLDYWNGKNNYTSKYL